MSESNWGKPCYRFCTERSLNFVNVLRLPCTTRCLGVIRRLVVTTLFVLYSLSGPIYFKINYCHYYSTAVGYKFLENINLFCRLEARKLESSFSNKNLRGFLGIYPQFYCGISSFVMKLLWSTYVLMKLLWSAYVLIKFLWSTYDRI